MSISNTRSFFHDSITPLAQDPCVIMPTEVVGKIFSYLSLHDLGVSMSVSRGWHKIARTPILWQTAIYRELAFSSKHWAKLDARLVKDVDMSREMLSLPQTIREELSCSAFPGESIKKTHVLVRMPMGLTINKLGEVAKILFPGNANGYVFIWSRIVAALGDKPADESVWLLMTNNILPRSRSQTYRQQEDRVAALAQTAAVPYQVPTTLEAATCILAEYARSGKRLFGNSPGTFTRCQETVEGYQVTVGGFAPAGFVVSVSYDGDDVGVAALRKF